MRKSLKRFVDSTIAECEKDIGTLIFLMKTGNYSELETVGANIKDRCIKDQETMELFFRKELEAIKNA